MKNSEILILVFSFLLGFMVNKMWRKPYKIEGLLNQLQVSGDGSKIQNVDQCYEQHSGYTCDGYGPRQWGRNLLIDPMTYFTADPPIRSNGPLTQQCDVRDDCHAIEVTATQAATNDESGAFGARVCSSAHMKRGDPGTSVYVKKHDAPENCVEDSIKCPTDKPYWNSQTTSCVSQLGH